MVVFVLGLDIFYTGHYWDIVTSDADRTFHPIGSGVLGA
jgi:hypothetical protein